MKTKILNIMPFLILPLMTPLYIFLDNVFLVDIFGCGCVPIAQTNKLNIPYNANDLRQTVYLILSIAMFVWSIRQAKRFRRQSVKVVYCGAVFIWNLLLTGWVVTAFMWQ